MTSRIFTGLALAVVACSSSFAAGLGGFLYVDATNGEWTFDDDLFEFERTIDTTSWRGGFALDTAPAADKLLNYRLQVGFGRLDADLESLNTELFELSGISVAHTIGFRLFHAESVKLWAGPHLRTGFFVGDLADDSTADTALLEVGAGGAIGANFNPGNRLTVSFEAGYYFAGYFGFVDTLPAETDITADSDGAFAALSLLVRIGRDRGRRDVDEDGIADGLDSCADTPRGAVVDATGCPRDTDEDGIADGLDNCTGTDTRAIVDATGCPKDTDSDGIADGIDDCAGTDSRAVVDVTGCPKDTDSDGIADGIDDCVGTDPRAIVDATGCPKDTDEDGIADGIDDCTGTDPRAIVDATGCPRDTDEDGIADGIDRCPDTLDSTAVDLTGCPAPMAAIQPDMRAPVVLEGVGFEFDSATLSPASLSVLERVARSLRDWPELRVEVGGHTDAAGSDEYNLSLSLQRAESVRDYLVDQGVDESRIAVRGYGASEPLGDNRVPEGRIRNRRVELKKAE